MFRIQIDSSRIGNAAQYECVTLICSMDAYHRICVKKQLGQTGDIGVAPLNLPAGISTYKMTHLIRTFGIEYAVQLFDTPRVYVNKDTGVSFEYVGWAIPEDLYTIVP